MSMSPHGIERFCQTLEQACGLNYPPAKSYLFEARLGGVIAQYGCRTYDDLTWRLRQDPAARQAIISALVTSETYFFRDEDTFKALPAIAERFSPTPTQPLVIWSLGCATGQEAYSILMTLDEAGRVPLPHLRVFGADISPEVLARAKAGLYSGFETQRGLSPARRDRYMRPVGDTWQIASPWRDVPQWVELNLLEGVETLPRPHVVFCRNILIYFSDATKTAVMSRILARLHDGGVVVLGNAENPLPYQKLAEVSSQAGPLLLSKPSPAMPRQPG